MNEELLQNTIHFGIELNGARYGIHKTEDGWFLRNQRGEYWYKDRFTRDNRSFFIDYTEAYLVIKNYDASIH